MVTPESGYQPEFVVVEDKASISTILGDSLTPGSGQSDDGICWLYVTDLLLIFPPCVVARVLILNMEAFTLLFFCAYNDYLTLRMTVSQQNDQFQVLDQTVHKR